MPQYCCAYGCSSSGLDRQRSFFLFRSTTSSAWTKRINRKNWQPSSTSVLCDLHFLPSDFVDIKSDRPTCYQKRRLKVGAIPSRLLRGETEIDTKRRRTRNSREERQCNPMVTSASSTKSEHKSNSVDTMESENINETTKHSDASTSCELDLSLNEARSTIAELQGRVLSFQNVNDENCIMYTGLDKKTFAALSQFLTNFQPFQYFTGKRVTSISFNDQLLCCLTKLKQNATDEDLAFRFAVCRKTIRNIFFTFVNVLYEVLYLGIMHGNLPSTAKTKTSMPSSFADFPNCRIIIDCTEINIDSPRSDLDALSATYSNYKSSHTAKFLVGVAPNGTIIFVSEAYSGNTSDKFITVDSGLLNQLSAGDLILADKGFTIHDVLPSGITVNIPPFLSGKEGKQFTESEARATRDIARARIHVERANQRIKSFRILNNFPCHYRSSATKLFRVCCSLVNLQSPLIKGILNTCK